MAQSATAAASLQDYRIPAGPLAPALREVASTANVLLAFTADQTEGRRTNGLNGRYSLQSALNALLVGTGLQAVLLENGSYVLREAADSDTAAGLQRLGRISVTDALIDPARTEGTGSYTTVATAAATRLMLSPRETPQSLSVITEQRMIDQDLDTIGKALTNTTGVFMAGLELERGDAYSRGFYVNQYLVDGLPVDLHTGMSGDPTSSSALYDRIEVVRGATGLLSGIGEPSASINLVRKQADSRELRLSAIGSVGSWNNYEGTLDVAAPLTASGKVRSRLVINHQDTESFLDRYESSRQLYYATVQVDVTDSTLLTVGGDYRKREPKGVTWGGLPPFYSDGTPTRFPRSTSVSADWTYWTTESKSVFTTLEQRLSEHWTAQLRYAFRESGFDQELLLLGGFPDRVTGEGMTTFSGAYRSNNRQNSYNVDLNGSVEALGRSHRLNIGYLGTKLWTGDGVSYAYAEDYGFAAVGDFHRWDGSFPRPNFGAGEHGTNAPEVTRQHGFYAATQIDIAEQLKAVAGARYSRWKLDDSLDPRDFEHLTPYFGLLYDFLGNFTAYVSYTDIFNPQESKGISGSFLDPVEGRSYEAGLKAAFHDNRLTLSLAAFRSLQHNFAEFGGYFDDTQPGPPGQWEYYIGVDGVTTRGVEAELAGEPARGWKLTLGASRLSMKDRHDNNVSTYLPRSMVRFFTSYRLPGNWNRLTVGAGANYNSRTSSEVWLPDDTVTQWGQGSTVIASLMGRYEFSPKLSAALNIDNLFDRSYAISGSSFAYGEPRNIQASIRYVW